MPLPLTRVSLHTGDTAGSRAMIAAIDVTYAIAEAFTCRRRYATIFATTLITLPYDDD